MAKVRVYELARKYEISSEALRKILVKEGITVKSHMSTVEERAEILIQQHMNRVKNAASARVKQKQKQKEKEKEKEKKKKPGVPVTKPPRARKPKKTVKRVEADQKAVQESVRRTLAKLEVTRKTKRKRRSREDVEVEEEENVIKLPEFSTVADLAVQLDVDPAEIIQKCFSLGLMVSINQRLDKETIGMISSDHGFGIKFVSTYGQDLLDDKKLIKPEHLVHRPPVITIMGHVDHGKTSLLDDIRQTNVVAGEKGGITQHIGAYAVRIKAKNITFIDTPGHKAFTAMRSRGAQATDIVIVIVAADDGVMPQTIEAINHAKAADVPIIIAINKIDLQNADIERVKTGLIQQNIVLEEYGGNIMCAEISAKKNLGIDKLLEMILLQAEMMELKADPDAQGRGVVIEAKKEEGRGIVTTVLIQQGTLRIGDIFVSGNHFGRVRALLNERGDKIKDAPPSTPAVILGCSGVAQAGDAFIQVEDEKKAKEVAARRQQFAREKDRRSVHRISLEELYTQIQEGIAKELNLIIRADTDGSIEVLNESLSNLSTDEVKVNVLHKAVGIISESDILLASASNAVVLGFHINATPEAARIAQAEKVDIRFYDVIYQAIDDIKDAMSGLLDPDIVEKELGVAEIREVFKVSKIGSIAGSYVKTGVIMRKALVRVLRDNEIIYKGSISSLKRFKDDAKEVQAGFECGIGVSGFEDLLEGDILEVYKEEEHSRTID